MDHSQRKIFKVLSLNNFNEFIPHVQRSEQVSSNTMLSNKNSKRYLVDEIFGVFQALHEKTVKDGL